MNDGYYWEYGRGMRDYYLDATGRIVGTVFYYLSDGKYAASTEATRIGEYTSAENARRAVERVIAQPPITKPDIIPRLPE